MSTKALQNSILETKGRMTFPSIDLIADLKTQSYFENQLESLPEPFPEIPIASFHHRLRPDKTEEPYHETFRGWTQVSQPLSPEDFTDLYSYLEDTYTEWEPPTADDFTIEWNEISTQQSRRRWLGIYNP